MSFDLSAYHIMTIPIMILCKLHATEVADIMKATGKDF